MRARSGINFDQGAGGGGGGGAGTVTSVDVAVPSSILTSSGGPITTSGVITLALTTQAANKVFAGPTTGADAAPTFRSIVVADLPTVTVPFGGTGNTTFTAYSVICAGTTDTGTFQNVSGLGTAGFVLTSNGAGALPSWQAASGGVTGSGTAGKVTKWSSTSAVAAAVLAEDSNGALSTVLAGGTTVALSVSNGSASAPIVSFIDNVTLQWQIADGGRVLHTPTGTLADGTAFHNIAGTLPSGSGESYYGLGINLTAPTTSNGLLIRGINQNITGGAITNSATYIRGYHSTISTPMHTPLAVISGTGTFGTRFSLNGSNTGTGEGCVGNFNYIQNQNIAFGAIQAIDTGPGTTPKSTGYQATIVYTGLDKCVGYSVIFTTALSDANCSPSPTVSACYYGTNGASALDLLNLQSSTTSRLRLADSGALYSKVNYRLDPVEFDDGNSGTSDTIDWANGSAHKSTLTGNVTYTFSNPVTGGAYLLKVLTGAGSFTVTWPGTVIWSGGAAPTVTTTAARADLFNFYWDGTSYYGSYSQNYTP